MLASNSKFLAILKFSSEIALHLDARCCRFLPKTSSSFIDMKIILFTLEEINVY